MMSEEKNETVLVTGGSGYVAGWMIVGLLRQGYRVRATLRNLEREKDVRAAIAGQVDAGGRLAFFQADLLRDDGWEGAVAGCDTVFHVASPMGQGDAKADLVRPAREGTLRVLQAASKHRVRRFIYTSSTAAAEAPSISGELQPRSDESTWTDAQKKGLGEYPKSKTLAERAAWDFIQQDSSGMTLTAVLPGMILGPVMAKSVSGSLEMIYRLLKGKVPAIPNIGFAITDVKDLVDLQLRAMTSPGAADQRFLAVGGFLWMSEMASLLRERLGPKASSVTSRTLPDFVVRLAARFQQEARFISPMLGQRREFYAGKAASVLGWYPRPSSEVVLACAESMLKKGLI